MQGWQHGHEMAGRRQLSLGLIVLLLYAGLSACASSDEPARGCGLEGSVALTEPAPVLVFACNLEPESRYHGDIVVMRPGEPARPLTHGEGWNYAPRWSPDGQKVVFGSTRSGSEQLYTMNADGTHVTQLTHAESFIGLAAWSPDGTHLAFGSSAAGLTGPLGVIHAPSDIYVANADGTNARRLTFSGGLNAEPAWSPDGRSIVFVSDRYGPYQVWVMNADGTDQHPLTNVGQNGSPAWSPDGTHIVFHSERDFPGGYRSTIYVMASDGSEQHRLVAGEGGWPTWSPDGRWIVYAGGPQGVWDLYAVHPDGSGLTRITDNESHEVDPSWAPA